jgi:hypothetical protein
MKSKVSEPLSAPLAKILEDSRIEWPVGSNTHFIPIDEVNRIIRPENIKAELPPTLDFEDPRDREEMASSIFSHAKKIFAILVLIGCQSSTREFLDCGITDEDLPLSRTSPSIIGHESPSFNWAQIQTRSGLPVEFLRTWDRHDVEEFCRLQWLFLSPVFNLGEGIRHYDLEDNCVLPFIEDQERTNTKSGGFSDVWNIRIHPAHQNLYQSTSFVSS